MPQKTASGDEAAAIAAVVARFEAEFASAPGGRPAAIGPWRRAALLEGVTAKETVQDSQGGATWPS